MITIRVESESFTRTMRGLVDLSKRPRSLLQAAARAVRRDLQRHFRARDKQPNALGGKRTHWWSRVARSTQIAKVTDRQAVLSISEPGIGIKVSGGVIRPVERRALTIPIHAEAYGRRAKTVEMITGAKLWVFRPRKGGPAFLARSLGDDTIRLLYVLKTAAQVKADPDALPPQEQMVKSAVEAAQAQLKSEILRMTRGPVA